MARENVTLAILFADIANSTHLYETLGNKTAQNLINNYISLFSEITEHHNGTVVKTIGDEIMCIFPVADNAVEAAMDMNTRLEQMPPVVDVEEVAPPNIYVGIQLGPVIKENDDVFGDAVNVAARMVSLAKQRQIFTTEETVKALKPEFQNLARWIDKTTIKGKSGEIDIYEVLWEQQDATIMADDFFSARTIQTRLELEFQGRKIQIDQYRPSVTLGRQSHNDLVVDDNRVSRSHARIEYRRGKFILIDQSMNGTYVLFQGKKSITLKRDETQLVGNGIVGLGGEVTSDSEIAIHFAITFI